MSDSRRNNHSHVAFAGMIIAIYIEAHRSSGQTFSHIPEQHFDTSLDKKHDVPLLIGITSQAVVSRLVNKQSPMPICRRCFGGNTRGMNVKTLCALSEHSG